MHATQSTRIRTCMHIPAEPVIADNLQGDIPSTEAILAVRNTLLRSPDLRAISNLEKQLGQQVNLTADASRNLLLMLQVWMSVDIPHVLAGMPGQCSGHDPARHSALLHPACQDNMQMWQCPGAVERGRAKLHAVPALLQLDCYMHRLRDAGANASASVRMWITV